MEDNDVDEIDVIGRTIRQLGINAEVTAAEESDGTCYVDVVCSSEALDQLLRRLEMTPCTAVVRSEEESEAGDTIYTLEVDLAT